MLQVSSPVAQRCASSSDGPYTPYPRESEAELPHEPGIRTAITDTDTDHQQLSADIALLQPSNSLVRTAEAFEEQSPVARWGRKVVSDAIEAKLFDFYVKHAGPWVRPNIYHISHESRNTNSIFS